MRLTKYGHACVRLEDGDRVLVIDPGTLSEMESLSGATAVLLTHEHDDHIDVDKLSAARGGNPALTVHTHAALAATLGDGVIAVAAGDTRAQLIGSSGRGRMLATALAICAATWGVVMALSPLLQVRRIIVQRSSSDVSIGYFGVLLVGFVLWIAYGMAIGNAALIVPNAVAFCVGCVTVTVALWHRPRRRP